MWQCVGDNGPRVYTIPGYSSLNIFTTETHNADSQFSGWLSGGLGRVVHDSIADRMYCNITGRAKYRIHGKDQGQSMSTGRHTTNPAPKPIIQLLSSQIKHPINLPNPTPLPLLPHQLPPQNTGIMHPLPQIHLRIPTTSPKPHILQPAQSQQTSDSLRNPQRRHRKHQPRPRQPDRQIPQLLAGTQQRKRHSILPLSARDIESPNPIPSHWPDVPQKQKKGSGGVEFEDCVSE